MEEVLRRENLMAAYRRVVRNKGAGVDGRSVDDLKHEIRTDWPRIPLLSGTYKPSPVLKVDSGEVFECSVSRR